MILFLTLIFMIPIFSQENKIEQINIAIANNNIEKFTKLLEGKIDLRDIPKDQTNPLFNSIFFGNYAITEMLLKNGADPNFQDACGTTPLHVAIKPIGGDPNSKINTIKILLAYGANPLIQDNFKRNAIGLTKNKKIIDILVKKNKD